MLRNISASDPDRVRRHLPTDLGDMSVEIRDQPVVCRRFVPTGSVQGLIPSERTSTGEILDDTRRLRRPRHAPGVHLRAAKPVLRLPTAKPAPGAMDGRVERRPRFGSFHSVEDHGVVPHRAADEAPLAGDGGRRALAHDSKIPFPVRFAPAMVMVVVHHPREGVTDDPRTCVRIVSSAFE